MISQLCGEGGHAPACDGTALQDGNPFPCACGCHFVPPYRGTVFVVVPEEEDGQEDTQTVEEYAQTVEESAPVPEEVST